MEVELVPSVCRREALGAKNEDQMVPPMWESFALGMRPGDLSGEEVAGTSGPSERLGLDGGRARFQAPEY